MLSRQRWVSETMELDLVPQQLEAAVRETWVRGVWPSRCSPRAVLWL